MRTSCSRMLAGVFLASLLLSGCGKQPAKQPVEKAEDVVEAFLDAWSRGESANTFADPEKPIQGDDPDWKAGYRLLSFLTIESRANQEGAQQFRCRVSLSLQDRKRRKIEKEVVYGVQLGEKSTIHRLAR